MTVDQLLKERDLDLDDVRWYLAGRTARALLTYRDREYDLTHYIWSGQLEDELYHMAERFLEDLQGELARGLTDPARVREIVGEIDAARSGRYTEGAP